MGIVIIGNGIAGLSAAEEIRKGNSEISIDIITDEKYHTYYRTQLSHYLGKDFKREDVYVHPEKWYEDKNIQVHLKEKVKRIDKVEKEVYLNSGKSLKYTKLLLANGAHSFMPSVEGSDKEGVFVLRDLDDVQAIQQYVKNLKEGIVVGGGLLGLEAASSLQRLGLKITVIEFFPRLLPRQLDEEGSEIIKKIVQDQGIDLMLGVQVEKLLGEKRVEGFKIKDGEIEETSFVLFSAGVRSNIQLAQELQLEVDRAIIVDQYMQTSERDIYAAGDVCEFNKMNFSIWPIAIEQGKIAGKNMLKNKETYQAITPSNMLNIMGNSIFSIGDIGEGEGEYSTLKYKDSKKDVYKKIFFKDNKVVGAILINDVTMAGKLKKLLKSEKDYSELLGKNLSDDEKIQQL
ncbi:FAD-dependent oxidoreductase [Irregularibacter muris]|uniref:FAD-dependent oxidoreductase n=1 Tax=Irregularibacter muris TaxID=1796619 RepID=A0AAE3L077_9FIRM|nr:FAD-dependent oxidoreductase [Irregularibacter muris]MCR1899866.1 FAD-dependent oxidoreductase [Irregularibacter muris]